MEGLHVTPSVSKLEQTKNGSCEQSMENSSSSKKFRETFLSKSPISTEKISHTTLERLKKKKKKAFDHLAGQNYFYK